MHIGKNKNKLINEENFREKKNKQTKEDEIENKKDENIAEIRWYGMKNYIKKWENKWKIEAKQTKKKKKKKKKIKLDDDREMQRLERKRDTISVQLLAYD